MLYTSFPHLLCCVLFAFFLENVPVEISYYVLALLGKIAFGITLHAGTVFGVLEIDTLEKTKTMENDAFELLTQQGPRLEIINIT